jgi:hypothetical protein
MTAQHFRLKRILSKIKQDKQTILSIKMGNVVMKGGFVLKCVILVESHL